ncbi:MAG: hypothetical protein M3Q27_14010 [Actinomycetota bacterium]|nr:hypothetical protein [Actinomycetota bacterium]
MAKALLGHVGGADPLMIVEVRRLRQRVRELEAQVMRLQAENDALTTGISHVDLMSLEVEHKEPALA